MIRGIFQLFAIKTKKRNCYSTDETATLEPKSDQAERQWSRLQPSVPLDNPAPWHSCGCSLNHKSHPNIAILMLTAVHDSVRPLACSHAAPFNLDLGAFVGVQALSSLLSRSSGDSCFFVLWQEHAVPLGSATMKLGVSACILGRWFNFLRVYGWQKEVKETQTNFLAAI